MKRAKHSLSHYKLLTADMGKLVPVSVVEVLPGDSFQQSTSALIRVSPLVAPVMHPVSVRFHHWFVPHRLVWDGWEDFITGGPDGIGGDAGAYPSQVITPVKGDLADYMGIPPGVASDVSLLAFRAFNKIYDEFYRDQDLAPERDPDDVSTIPNIAWEKDYFTSSRPWPQKGPDVTMPLGQTAPVVGTGGTPSWNVSTGASPIQSNAGTANVLWSAGSQSGNTQATWATTALQADLAAAVAPNINDVRRAFAIQRYQEARAMYGSRYTEYLAYLGIRSSDARLQRPEYLGGGKQTISFSEVLKTGAGEDPAEEIGTMKGHGIAALRSRRYRRFFEEHGHVITVMSVRPRTMYVNALHRSWSRRAKEDYYQRELEQIGQQEVYAREVYAQAAPASETVWGYNDRYSEYRHIPSQVAGDFRDTLNYWHLARDFAAPPVLNQSFIECDPSKRIHAEQTTHVLWCMVNNNIQARRMLGKPGIPRIF